MPLSPDPPPWPDGSEPPQQWEYATASLSGSDPYADITASLNAYGAAGWALVATEGHYLVFQRPTPPPPATRRG
jgi:hypothetical protein